MTDQASREAFEQFCKKRYFEGELSINPVTERYADAHVYGDWLVWQAALTHANSDTKADNAMLLEAIKANTEVGAINVSLQMELASLRSDLDKANTEMEKMRGVVREWVDAQDAFKALPEDAYLDPQQMDKLTDAIARKNAAETALREALPPTPKAEG